MLWLLSIILVILLGVRWWKLRPFVDLSDKVKSGIKRYPFVGHSYLFAGDGANRMQTFQRFGREAIKNGGATNLWLGDKCYIHLVDAVDIEVILKSALEKDNVMRFARKLVGNGLIFAPVSIWRPRRKVLAPTFSVKNLNSFVEIFTRQSDVMVKQLKTAVGRGVSVWQYLTTYTLDSVCETTLGVKLNAQLNPEEPFLKSFETCCKLIATRMVQPWLYSDSVYKLLPYHSNFVKNKRVISDFINNAITSKRKAIKANNNKIKSTDIKTFLDLLIEMSSSERGYSDLELFEETMVIVVAGTDTSAVGLSFTIALLARHPDVQERAFEELLEVFGESDRPITPEDLPRLKYLDAVLKESLRLYPPVPIIVREIEKELVLPSGLTLIPGCGVMINIWGTHRNPSYWGDDAEHYRPERFLDTPLENPAAYLAFSYGPRGCMGYQYATMSMKTALASFLRNYKILNIDDEVKGLSNQPLKLTFDVMMKDVDGFQVKLERRNRQKML